MTDCIENVKKPVQTRFMNNDAQNFPFQFWVSVSTSKSETEMQTENLDVATDTIYSQ